MFEENWENTFKLPERRRQKLKRKRSWQKTNYTYMLWPTQSLKQRNFWRLWVLSRGNLNFCVRGILSWAGDHEAPEKKRRQIFWVEAQFRKKKHKMVVEDAVRRKPALKPKSKRHKQKTARVKRNQKWICGHVWWNSDFITATLQWCILTRQTKGMNSARQIMEQLFHYGHFVVMHVDKTNKG